MSILVGAFLPPEGVWVPCGDWPDAWTVEPLAPGTGRPRESQRDIAAQLWPLVERTCKACPVLEACRDYGLDPEHIDEPMVYGGMSRHMRQHAVRGWISTENGARTDRVRWLV